MHHTHTHNDRKRGEAALSTQLTARTDLIFSVKCAVWLLAIGGAMAGLASLPLIYAPIFVVLMGLMMAHGVELQHQALHLTGFRSERANELAGKVLGAPMFVSFWEYKTRHMAHHRYLGTDKDVGFFAGLAGPSTWRSFFANLFMVEHYGHVAQYLARTLGSRQYDAVTQRHASRIASDYLMMLAAVAVGSLVLLATHQLAIFFGFWAALFLVAGPAHALIELPEHYECDPTTRDVTRNTRTISTNSLLVWYTNGNNYHVEHHRYPRLPMESLAEAHGLIAPELAYHTHGYRAFFRHYAMSRQARKPAS
jgi:fatty acid desaturase